MLCENLFNGKNGKFAKLEKILVTNSAVLSEPSKRKNRPKRNSKIFGHQIGGLVETIETEKSEKFLVVTVDHDPRPYIFWKIISDTYLAVSRNFFSSEPIRHFRFWTDKPPYRVHFFPCQKYYVYVFLLTRKTMSFF